MAKIQSNMSKNEHACMFIIIITSGTIKQRLISLVIANKHLILHCCLFGQKGDHYPHQIASCLHGLINACSHPLSFCCYMMGLSENSLVIASCCYALIPHCCYGSLMRKCFHHPMPCYSYGSKLC